MLKTKLQVILISSILLIIAGISDYYLQYEIASSLLYIIPIYFFSYQNRISLKYVILFSSFAGAQWFLIDFATHPYPNDIYLIWNSFTRLIIFLLISIVLKRIVIEQEQNQIISVQKQQLLEINQKLLESNTELNKLIGIAAHDIRNPVGNIISFSELLVENNQTLTEEERKILRIIHTSSKNALQILNDTLNISQINSGTLILNKVSVDYISFIKECIALNKYLADNKKQNIRFVSTIDSKIMEFDESRMQQAFTNLLTNAIKYSDFNTTIVVNVTYSDDNQSHLKTEIIDQGLGIVKEDKSIIFQPFSTTSNIPTDNESRTGLGLAITKKIIELHNGTIDFISEKGKGSNFFFTIPI